MPHWSEPIYIAHRRNLFGYALSIVRCPSAAEDAIHNTFAKLVRLENPVNTNPISFVFRCVKNSCIDILRAKKTFSSTESIELFSVSEEDDPDIRARKEEDRKILQQALDKLNYEQREVILMHFYSGLTFQLIAEALEAPLGTVTSRYQRGIKELRQYLESYHAQN